MIIGVSGKIGSGKDTIGNIIQYLTSDAYKARYRTFEEFLKRRSNVEAFGTHYYSPWEIKKFADKLKDCVCLIIGCTREQLEDINFKNKELGEEWRVWYWIDNQFDKHRISKIYFTEHDASFFNWHEDGSIPKLVNEILTPRKILQLLGTECGREIIHPNIWVNATFASYGDFSEEHKKAFVESKSGYSLYELKTSHRSFYEVLKEEWINTFPKWIVADVRFPNEVKAIQDRGGILIRVNRPQLIPRDFEHESETALDNYNDFNYIINNTDTIDDLIKKVERILRDLQII